jgi:hypothetical protein
MPLIIEQRQPRHEKVAVEDRRGVSTGRKRSSGEDTALHDDCQHPSEVEITSGTTAYNRCSKVGQTLTYST